MSKSGEESNILGEGEMKEQVVCPWQGPGDHYKAGVLLVWCSDRRFIPAMKAFIRHRGYKNADTILLPGGAKALASLKKKQRLKADIKRIKTLLDLHGAPKIVLMTHTDCGAYKGASDEVIKADLPKAKRILRKRLPNKVEIEMVFVSKENVLSLE